MKHTLFIFETTTIQQMLEDAKHVLSKNTHNEDLVLEVVPVIAVLQLELQERGWL